MSQDEARELIGLLRNAIDDADRVERDASRLAGPGPLADPQPDIPGRRRRLRGPVEPDGRGGRGMTTFRERDRVRVEFEGVVTWAEAPHPFAPQTDGSPVWPSGMGLRIDDNHTAFVFPQSATLLERPESEAERRNRIERETAEHVARLERENAEMKARLAELEGVPVEQTSMDRHNQFSAEATARAMERNAAPVADRGPTILIDKITRWFTKR